MPSSGRLVGFIAVLPFSLIDGIEGSDLKLFAHLGPWFGGAATFSFLFWSAMCGMVMATSIQLLGTKDFPFAPAIASGHLISAGNRRVISRL